MLKNSVINDFPLLVNKKSLGNFIYFDNAATVQVPSCVLDVINQTYMYDYASVARSTCQQAELFTATYEQVRAKVAEHLGASGSHLVLFTAGVTHAINGIAGGLDAYINNRDEIVISALEHHANSIPWQQLALKKNAVLRVLPIESDGTLCIDRLDDYITSKTKLVAITHCSNVFGVPIVLDSIISRAKEVRALVLVDAAQSIPYGHHNSILLQADFIVFSGHKIGAGTGGGVLYMSHNAYDICAPWAWGGGMAQEVNYHFTTPRKGVARYEAGTGPIVQAIAIERAMRYVYAYRAIHKNYEAQLCALFIQQLKDVDRVVIVGNHEAMSEAGHIISFFVRGIHAHDVAEYLNQHGICVRAGNHCAQPLLAALGYNSLTRISFFIYNTFQEVYYTVDVIKNMLRVS